MQDNPGIYVKSHPRGGENRSNIKIHLSTITDDERAKERLQKAAMQLSVAIRENGGKLIVCE
jgi:hypothetical protein